MGKVVMQRPLRGQHPCCLAKDLASTNGHLGALRGNFMCVEGVPREVANFRRRPGPFRASVLYLHLNDQGDQQCVRSTHPTCNPETTPF